MMTYLGLSSSSFACLFVDQLILVSNLINFVKIYQPCFRIAQNFEQFVWIASIDGFIYCNDGSVG